MPRELIQVGEPAPSFTTLDHTGTKRSLSDYRGKTVALYFYPRDNTPGCTRQACSLRDGHQQLMDAGVTVLGISPDSPDQHKKFREQYNLPFTLLCDPNKEIATQYGALRKFFLAYIPKRVTIIINPEGIVTHVITKVQLDKHAAQVCAALTT